MWRLAREFYQATKEYGLVSSIEQVILYLSALSTKFFSKRQSNRRRKKNYKIDDTVNFSSKFDPKSLKGSTNIGEISWILPSFSRGSGGHTTIFRFAKYFEIMGFTNHFIVRNAAENVDTLKDNDA